MERLSRMIDALLSEMEKLPTTLKDGIYMEFIEALSNRWPLGIRLIYDEKDEGIAVSCHSCNARVYILRDATAGKILVSRDGANYNVLDKVPADLRMLMYILAALARRVEALEFTVDL